MVVYWYKFKEAYSVNYLYWFWCLQNLGLSQSLILFLRTQISMISVRLQVHKKACKKIQWLEEDLLRSVTCGLQHPCSRDIKMDISKSCRHHQESFSLLSDHLENLMNYKSLSHAKTCCHSDLMP